MPNFDENKVNEKILNLTEKLEDLEKQVSLTDKRFKTLLANLKNGYGFYDTEFLDEEELPEHPHNKIPEPFDEEDFNRRLRTQVSAADEYSEKGESSETTVLSEKEKESAKTLETKKTANLEKEILDPAQERHKKIMSFWEHVEEFRWVIIKSSIILFITISLAFLVTKYTYKFLMYPIDLQVEKGAVELIYDSPISAFLIQLKMGILGGLIFALPIIIFFIWRFISPGLKKSEQNATLVAIFAGTIFFLFGTFFGYTFIPLGLPVLIEFGAEGIKQLWSIDTYIGFTIKLVLAFGILFEMPVILGLLSKLGLITSETLRRHRKMAIVIIVILAAILTPPDPFSQIALAIPMLFLYQFSILIAKFNERRIKE